MIVFLLYVILFVICWPLALLVAFGWIALLILRVFFGITVFAIKATTAAGIGGAMAGLALIGRGRSKDLSARLRDAGRPVPWSPTDPR